MKMTFGHTGWDLNVTLEQVIVPGDEPGKFQLALTIACGSEPTVVELFTDFPAGLKRFADYVANEIDQTFG